jgi:hypothetical protein
MEPVKGPPTESHASIRSRWQLVLALDVLLASWVALDAYGKTNAPGPRALWATLAWLIVFATLWLTYRRHANTTSQREDGEQVIDAMGVKRPVAHAASAGWLAGNLPPELLRDIRDVGGSNFATRYELPKWRAFVPVLVLAVGLAIIYWGAVPPIVVCFSLGISALLSNGYNPAPTRMAEAYLRHKHCPSCTYPLAAVPAQTDGRTICPECGASWRL